MKTDSDGLKIPTDGKNGSDSAYEAEMSGGPHREEVVRSVLKRIHDRGIRVVDFWFTEMSGRPWRISMSAASLDERLFSSGVAVDGRSIGGSWEGLILILPDASAAYIDPVASVPTLSVLCDVADAGSRKTYSLDPRQALKRAEEHLRGVSAAERWSVGAEPEFFLLENHGHAASEESVWELLRAMAVALGEAGIPVDWFRTGPRVGQGRVQMRAAPALRTADHVILYKNIARNLAKRGGRTASFLPKPLAGEGAANFLVHHTFWRGGQNLFHDPDGWAMTSELCRQFAAGLLKHAPALAAFCAPTMNSYRRLLPGSGAPTDLVLSRNRSSAACRIPARSAAPETRRVKFACSDSSANPYLAFAAMLMAGLDGVENRLEPAIDELPPDGPRLPHSLEEALTALEDDQDFLRRGGVFTEELIQAWIRERWKLQVLPVRSEPHPSELRLDGTWWQTTSLREELFS